MAKVMKFNTQVFVDGALQSRMLRGPSDFASWECSWAVFRSAMVMLKAAAPQTLDNYHNGIRELSTLYGPAAWGIISLADEVNRSERWANLADDLADSGSSTPQPSGTRLSV